MEVFHSVGTLPERIEWLNSSDGRSNAVGCIFKHSCRDIIWSTSFSNVQPLY